MTAEKWKVIAIVLMGVLAVACGEALLAKGMKGAHGTGLGLIRHAVTSPYIVIGTLLMGLYFGSYLTALSKADQSFVLPLTAVSYPLGTLLARYYLHESVTPTRWIGIVVITFGVVIVGLGEKDAGSAPAPAAAPASVSAASPSERADLLSRNASSIEDPKPKLQNFTPPPADGAGRTPTGNLVQP